MLLTPVFAWRKVGWLAGTGMTVFVAFVVYAFASEPILESCTGGMSDSVTTAALIGLMLLSVAVVAVWRLHQRLWPTFLGCVGTYVLALLALADLAPLIWGPRQCTSIGFF